MVVKAKMDKETKGTFRYQITKNELGISGSIYLNKNEHPNPEKTLYIKIDGDLKKSKKKKD